MRRVRMLLASLLVCIVPALEAAEYHFVNAHLITMADEPIRAGEVLVRDAEIVAVGTRVEPGADAVRIDVAGGYLLPGLAEMHAHVPAPSQGDTYRNEVLFLYVANGVTTARGMLGSPAHLALRDALATHEVLGPRLITSGPSFNGNSVSSPEQAAGMAREQAASGYDFLKIHPGLTRAEYDAVAAAARAAGIPFAGHVPAAVGLRHALASGQATIDHLDGYVQALVTDSANVSEGLFVPGLLQFVDIERIAAVVDATKAAGAWVVPTETLIENFAAAAGNADSVDARPENRYLPRDLRERYREALRDTDTSAEDAARFIALRKRLLHALYEANAGILLGSDAPQIYNVPGFSAHRELEAMVTAGMSPLDALRAGTLSPATFFDREDEFGTLAPGRAADIVWLRANPQDDIRNTRTIQGVMVRGRWLDRTAIDAGLERIARRHAG